MVIHEFALSKSKVWRFLERLQLEQELTSTSLLEHSSTSVLSDIRRLRLVGVQRLLPAEYDCA